MINHAGAGDTHKDKNNNRNFKLRVQLYNKP